MAQKPAVQAKHVATQAPAKPQVEKEPVAQGPRGPKGVDLTARITIMAAENPKRPGSKAFDLWEIYGRMKHKTVQEFLDLGGTTPALIYDSAHGFIQIAGYTPPNPFVKKERPAKAEKADKPAKAGRRVAQEVDEEETEE